jgi:hypothetical protein
VFPAVCPLFGFHEFEFEGRVKRAATFIVVAIAHLKSALAGNATDSVEMALAWLLDAKSELQPILDVMARNAVILVDSATVTELAKKARVRREEAIEALVGKCIEEHVSGHG